MAQTAVRANLLQALQIVTNGGVERVRVGVRVFAGGKVFASVQHPHWNFELARVLHHCHHAFDLLWRQFAGATEKKTTNLKLIAGECIKCGVCIPFVSVHVSFFAANSGVTTADTFDGSQC